jgi:glycosyltransferase involved in cell wall biosynthesis
MTVHRIKARRLHGKEAFSILPAVKLIIQIPCYNEERTLPMTLADLPRRVEGFDSVEWQVMDDGSTDRTVEVAKAHGVEHIVRMSRHAGLAQAFAMGLRHALARGADVIVNTDADHPYKGEDIPRLTEPLLAGRADIVVGCRRAGDLRRFSPVKRFLHRFGSRVVNGVSGLHLADVTSGFRAYGREAAVRLLVFSSYSYTLETLIQAGRIGLRVESVSVEALPETRPSRLFRSVWQYVLHSAVVVLRVTMFYYPLRVFLGLSALCTAFSVTLAARYLYLHSLYGAMPGRHLPSLILAGALLVLGMSFGIAGLLADLIAVNRILLEESIERQRRHELACRESSRL